VGTITTVQVYEGYAPIREREGKASSDQNKGFVIAPLARLGAAGGDVDGV
jgi:hypothetical protein